MNFELDEEQKTNYERIFDFGKSIRHLELQAQWDKSLEFGILGLCMPVEYGGMGLGALDTALGLEAFSRGCCNTGLAFALSAHLLACARPLADILAEPLRGKLLPDLCQGKKIAANAMTEPEAGSDTSQIKTRAVKQGDSYILNGIKCFVTNGPVADLFLVYANANPAHGYQGISVFLVEKGTPGLKIGQDLTKLGPIGSTIGELHFNDCVVPSEMRLGDEGIGAEQFKSAMAWERACLFAIYLGQMQNELEWVLEHATTRKQFRKVIGKNQAISHKIANMKIRIESARWLLYHACWTFDQLKDHSQATLEIAMAKTFLSESAVQNSLDTLQIFGGSGILSESLLERGLRNAVPSTVFSGTSEIQRDLIARSLGL